MTLPIDIARCRGKGHDSPAGVITHPDCVDCERRLAAVADYIAGNRVLWMAPRDETPCSEKLEVTA